MPSLKSGFKFVVVDKIVDSKNWVNVGVLVKDSWDDWFKYNTTYLFTIFDTEGKDHEIGLIKIGQIDMEKAQRRPKLDKEFKRLDSPYFSLGQSDTYYENLNKLGHTWRNRILVHLRDIANDEEIWATVRELDVVKDSLLRSVSESSVEGQFRRIARGNARLTNYRFTYNFPKRLSPIGETNLEFRVRPNSNPPTNIHVLIGRNGSGKTHFLNLLIKSIIGSPNESAQSGNFELKETNDESSLAGVVFVSFSAFDSTELHNEGKSQYKKIDYKYIGLRRHDKSGPGRGLGTPKSSEMLAKEFNSSLIKNAQEPSRKARWKSAIATLESDPIFKYADISKLIEPNADERANSSTEKVDLPNSLRIFQRLSSGHQIVLLTITRLIESIEEKSLILIDEPEAHLHPPLLSAFIRALSDLLVDRNGVALIATHSPVILQEVPKECVWILDRTGTITKVNRPEFETFGENLGLLTRGVFGYEVTDSGFHKLLSKAAEVEESFEDAELLFDNKLGGEARAILRAHFLRKERDRNS